MSGRHIAMGTLGFYGGSGDTIIEGIYTTVDTLRTSVVLTHRLNAVAVPYNLKKIQRVNLNSAIVCIPNEMQVIQVTNNDINC